MKRTERKVDSTKNLADTAVEAREHLVRRHFGRLPQGMTGGCQHAFEFIFRLQTMSKLGLPYKKCVLHSHCLIIELISAALRRFLQRT